MSDETLAFKIQEHEGFRPKPYWDPIGEKWTIGYGFTYMTKEEAHITLHIRLHHIHQELNTRIHFFWRLPTNVQEVLVEMAFQMGVDGLLGFKKMLKHLEAGNYEMAAKEIKDSKLYQQVPKRAEYYIERMLET